MTATIPPSGTPAARRPGPRPVPARSVVAALIAMVLCLGMLVTGVRANADTTPAPTPTPTTSGEITLTLAPVGNGVFAPGGTLSAWITQRNGTTRAVAESTATLLLGTAALDGRPGISSWLAGDTAADLLVEIARVPLPATAAGDDGTAVAAAPPDVAALQSLAPGVYPLLARTSGGEASLSARSVVVVPGAAAATPVGVVVPLTAGPSTRGLLTSDELAALTAADGLLTGTLDAVVGTPAILAVDPAIPAAIRVLGSAAPETATAWLNRLMGLPNERFALQFADADAAAQIAAGAPGPLQPTSLAPYLDAGDFAEVETTASPTPTPTATPTPAPTPDEPPLPDLPTLLDIGPARSDVYWPVTGTADAGVVAALGAASTGGQPSLTLVASSSTDAAAGQAAVPASGRAGDARLLVYDSATSDALRRAAVTPETALRAAALTEATAFLSLGTQNGDPLMVVVDRANDFARTSLRAAITAATQAPGVSPATLDQLVAVAPAEVGITGGAPDAARVAAASELIADETSLQSFSSILDDSAVLLVPERAEMLQMLGAAWYPQPESWSTAFATHRDETAATLDAVGILPPTTTNLISSDAGFGFWVRNDLAWPVNVVLSAQPDDLRLNIARTTQVRAEPASNTRIDVPVEARLGNGEVTIALQLRSPTGIDIGAPQARDVNVRAEWEGVGVVILAVLIGGLLVLGLVRTVLHRRWLRRQAATGQTDATTPESTDAAVAVPGPGDAGMRPYEDLP